MILVTTGTSEYNFTRLFNILDQLCAEGFIKDELIVQTGMQKYESKYYKTFGMISNDEFKKLIDKSTYIISHAGTGSVISALKKNKKVIIFPRFQKNGEHTDNHQLELAKLFNKSNYTLCAKNKKELIDCIKKINEFEPQKFISNNSKINNIIIDFIDNIK